MKIMASGPITSWQIDGGKVETVTDSIFLGSKITVDGDSSHEIKRHWLLGSSSVQFSRSVVSNSLRHCGLQHLRLPCPSPTPEAYSNSCPSSWCCHPTISSWKAMTNLDTVLKSRDITFPTKVCIVKAMIFPIVMYGRESWTIKKAKRQRIDVFELWCWRKLLRVPWTARSNQSIRNKVSLEYSLKGLMLKLQ